MSEFIEINEDREKSDIRFINRDEFIHLNSDFYELTIIKIYLNDLENAIL